MGKTAELAEVLFSFSARSKYNFRIPSGCLFSKARAVLNLLILLSLQLAALSLTRIEPGNFLVLRISFDSQKSFHLPTFVFCLCHEARWIT
jgi:hypothetical protein